MHRTLKKIIFVILALGILTTKSFAQNSGCSLVDAALPIAIKIRGLKPKAKVPCQQKTKKDVEKYLNDTLNEQSAKIKMKHEEIIYKLLGFIPEDFDYIREMVQFYSDQVGGFYDPKKKFYAMASWMPESLQLPIAVHELTHALQDQHFNLEKLMDDKVQNTDTILAHSALAEGDATAVMLDFSLNSSGLPPIAQQKDVKAFLMQNIIGAMLTSNLSNAPKSLQTLMIFPYTSGLNFVHHFLMKNGYQEVDSVFRNPPNSTSEILHPENYGTAGNKSENLPVPIIENITKSKNSNLLLADTFGEFLISTLIANWLAPDLASQAANGWKTDKLGLYEEKVTKKNYLLWEILWKDNKEAEEFFTSIINAYEVRFKTKLSCDTSRCSHLNNKFNLSITLSENKVRLAFE